MKKETVRVEGMSCAACSSRIEKALGRTDGVISSFANFSSNTVTVEYDENKTSMDTVSSVIESAGYTVVRKDTDVPDRSRYLSAELAVAAVFTAPILLISMGPMFGLTLISDYGISSMIQLILCIPVVIIGRRFFIRGIPALLSRSPTMDTLVALGSGTAFVYSIVVMILYYTGNVGETHLYFESTAMIITLISVGKCLESRSREKADDAIKGLRHLIPQTANIFIDGKETAVNIDEIELGDRIILRPGERVPLDSVITEGRTSVDESMLTGESMPVVKTIGDRIYAGTMNTDGSVTAEVTAVGKDSVLSGVIRMVEDARSTKAPIARMADRVASRFVPIVIAIALAACIIWLIAGKDIAFALTVMISVLVISCPCAMGLATPLAITVGTGRSAEYGILFRNATSLEYAGRVDSVIFDKTGTVSEGRPSVIGVFPQERRDEILYLAAIAESRSEHPVAGAIMTAYGREVPQATDFDVVIGAGIRCTFEGKKICAGSRSIIGSEGIHKFDAEIRQSSSEGATVIFVEVDGSVIGMISVKDTIRSSAEDAVRSLSGMGISTKMVTGDTAESAGSAASAVGISDVLSCSKPDDKVYAVKKLQASGHDVAMVGDGINDAPALVQADLGIAIGSGTDIAVDSADVIIMNDDLRSVPSAIEIGRATLRNIKENLFFAFCYNTVCIPIAAGLPYLFGISLIESMPMIAATAMSLSSLSVVTNALRLRRFRPRSHS